MIIEEIEIDEQIGEVGRILSKQERKRGLLIHVLQQIQENDGYLQEEVLRRLSKNLNISLAEIYSVASFYKMFHFKPRGRKIVRVCLGTACYVRGSKKILTTLEEEFGIKNGETTEDLAMTLETVGCIGCCGLAPVTMINEEIIGEIGTKKIEGIVNAIKEE
ncbi:MAG: NADH-quinone oxidoreductase subunit NuoE [Nitrospirae bacterium CG_4_10_14_0_8_um_filter_41_23]|nr:NADH-quinone oxidoreductase subunit NuoE [Nitrospirota bacterium]OIP59242.1 MAG: NADH dehydrogenase [Nitrospirae bacterium CG2_30_41_42]PIQ94344.1 MAG: NADH-quinone oxidoreductase subunit NuoE [Nitrospirae bacterium CG11_big_fil_rev_8_21_14_0_20_41_14]PIV44151.1 MAG: NADH-quinone oxidoreductase subunit NuoE [Nitrospirae bacterium CG02_land_8_20_14_3_00_41_53]PIW87278.1 MAG: NADH-quinone oxidoreductase subunit NuoE [Nitrospirae bacterium CG_4_8_14_3_um_filter_41_47]PIY86829.1 MAG: NADH-quino